MSENTFDPKEASGEAAMQGGRALELNEVSLNGDGSAKEIAEGKWERGGGFFRERILIGNPKDQKPEEINLGKSIRVVFLKIRRRLVERGKDGKIIRSTGEHNTPKDAVTLYEPETKRRINGVAEDLREQFGGLRTVQVVYALLYRDKTDQPELVRLTIKGASLGSEVKAKDVMDFYGYISSFRKDNSHFYEFETILTPVLEQGKQTYFAIDFKRGEKLGQEDYAYVLEQMERVHNNCVEVDKLRASRIIKASETTDDVVDDTLPPHMKDDVNPDDIPF